MENLRRIYIYRISVATLHCKSHDFFVTLTFTASYDGNPTGVVYDLQVASGMVALPDYGGIIRLGSNSCLLPAAV